MLVPSYKVFKVMGQPLLSLGMCVFFSRQGSGSSTVHLNNTMVAELYNKDKKKKGEENSELCIGT